MTESTPPVMAISGARDNADLIAYCAQLGYLQADIPTLDLTFGIGAFWRRWRPNELITNDLYTRADYAENFRSTHWLHGQWGQVVFDPPYKLNGTPSHPSDKRYGVDRPVTWQDRMKLIMSGALEAARITKPGGIILIKCQDQISSGKPRWQTIEVTNHLATTCALEDMLHLTSYRAQPEGRTQQHARRNYSTLLVFRRFS